MSEQPTMLQSAVLYPGDQIPAGNTQKPGEQLQTVDPTGAFEAWMYRARDFELADRDLTVAAKIAEISLLASTVWNSAAPRLVVPWFTLPTIYNDPADAHTNNSPGSVDHVRNSDSPFAAASTDRQLYSRDIVVWEALSRMSRIFPQVDDFSVDSAAVVDNTWSLAEGAPGNETVSCYKPLDRNLFRNPDRALADRDNVLARYAALLNKHLYNVFEHANRLLVKVYSPDPQRIREQEIYALVDETETYREWAAEPFLSRRLRLRYDKVFKTLQWTTEHEDTVQPPQPVWFGIPGLSLIDPLSFSGFESEGSLSVVPASPPRRDSQWYRQKSSKVELRTSSVDEVFLTTPENPAYSHVSGGFPTDTGTVSMNVPGTVRINLPGVYPAGLHYVYLRLKPSNEFSFKADTHQTESGDGSVVFPGQGSVCAWNFPLPPVNPVYGWYAEILYRSINGVPPQSQFSVDLRRGLQLIPFPLPATTDGAYRTQVAPTTLQVQSAAVDNLTLRLLSQYAGSERLEVDRIRLFSTYAEPADFYFRFEPGDEATAMAAGFPAGGLRAEITGIPNRPDVVRFPVEFSRSVTSPVFILSWLNANNYAVEIQDIEVRRYATRVPISHSEDYRRYRTELLEKAAEEVRERYRKVIPSGGLIPELREIAVNVGEAAYPVGVSVFDPRARSFTCDTGSKSVTTYDPEGYSYGVGDTVVLYVPAGLSTTRTVTSVARFSGLVVLSVDAAVDTTKPVSGYALPMSMASSFTAENLPDGLSIGEATGVISGTPSLSSRGSYDVVVTHGEDEPVGLTLRVGAGNTYPFTWTSQSTRAWMEIISRACPRCRTQTGTGTSTGTSAFTSTSEDTDFQGLENSVIIIDGVAYEIANVLSESEIELNVVVPEGTDMVWTVPGAFRPGRPSDTGCPALVPEGIQFVREGLIVGNLPADQSEPVVRAFQPWMYSVGLYVADDDFRSRPDY